MKTALFAAAAVLVGSGQVAMAQERAPAQGAPQTPAAPAATPRASEPPTVSTVTVTGQGNETRTSIDRRSYGVATDLQATSGSISDALRNIPSVEVDTQGNISLRGDPNVTIMIDGKPSGMFRGESRATALQQLPAEQIERVEVMTNPSAAFRPDGSGGVINLVTKKGRGAGKSGSIRGAVGTDGRYNGGASYTYNGPKLAVNADAGFRHDKQEFEIRNQRERLDPASGVFLQSRNHVEGLRDANMRNGRLSVDYDPDANNRFSGEVRGQQFQAEGELISDFTARNAAGGISQAYLRDIDQWMRVRNGEVSGSYRRKFSGMEHEFTADLSFERTDFRMRNSSFFDQATPALPNPYDLTIGRAIFDKIDGKAEYKRPFGDDGKLVAGYSLELFDNEYDNYVARGSAPGALTADPSLSNFFVFEQSVQALYGTYQHVFGDLTVLGGLRLEQTDIEIDQVTSNIQASNDYFNAYPSLHLQYKLSDEQQLTGSYSRRVQRPQPQDLNPYRNYQDPYNYRQGNPYLDPQITDSFEAGWQFRKGPAFYQATLFWRQSENGFTDVVRDLGGGVLLTTKENLAESRSGGLELVANGRLHRKLSYNLSGTAYYNEIAATNLGLAEDKSGYSFQARGSLNYQATPKDMFQVNGFVVGEQLTPQGYRASFGMLNLGYRRQLTPKLTLNVNVQDALGTMRQKFVVDTPVLRDSFEFKPNARAAFVSLTYAFGASNNRRAPPRPDQAPDFDAGGGGGMGPL
jgi:outer membrane receptor protein involved in Fe transport